MNEARREVFENWYIAQFGDDKKYKLNWDRMTGYQDEMTNFLWVGFNAGAESVNW